MGQLKALIINAPDQLRHQLRQLTTHGQLQRCSRLRTCPAHSTEHRATILALRSTARRAIALTTEAGELEFELHQLVHALAPTLLAEPGVGPITAAQLLSSWSHPGRFRSEAAFASLAGAAPIPASSGQTVRHRLNRGGDRQLNRALHTIALSRLGHHPETKRYAARRTAEGKTPREIRRCLKRHLARRLYRILDASTTGAGNPLPRQRPAPAASRTDRTLPLTAIEASNRSLVDAFPQKTTKGATPEWLQSSGISRPKASRVIASGSGPPRRPVSRPSIAAISSADSSKSNTLMFSAMRLGLVDFGMTERPCCRPQRSITCAGLLPWAVAMSPMTGSSRVLPWLPSR